MNIQTLKNEFFQSLKDGLEVFSKTEHNKDIYAMAFICDSSIGMLMLSYNNKARFQEMLAKFIPYKKHFGLPIYGLHGNEYNIYEFDFIDYQVTDLVDHFLDSCCYYSIGEYYGTGFPIEGIENNYREIYQELIIDTINSLKTELRSLHIDITDDFAFFFRDIDHSQKTQDLMFLKTVDKELADKLAAKGDC